MLLLDAFVGCRCWLQMLVFFFFERFFLTPHRKKSYPIFDIDFVWKSRSGKKLWHLQHSLKPYFENPYNWDLQKSSFFADLSCKMVWPDWFDFQLLWIEPITRAYIFHSRRDDLQSLFSSIQIIIDTYHYKKESTSEKKRQIYLHFSANFADLLWLGYLFIANPQRGWRL